jgi:DNA polymerase-3 subunit gamma/tau
MQPAIPPSREMPEGEVPAEGPETFADLIELLRNKRDIALQTDVERFVRPAGFKPGSFTYQPTENCPPDLAQRLAKRLLEWTGARWAILASGDAKGGETWFERRQRLESERLERAQQDPAVMEVMRLFPGAELLAVRSAETEDTSGEARTTTEKRA